MVNLKKSNETRWKNRALEMLERCWKYSDWLPTYFHTSLKWRVRFQNFRPCYRNADFLDTFMIFHQTSNSPRYGNMWDVAANNKSPLEFFIFFHSVEVPLRVKLPTYFRHDLNSSNPYSRFSLIDYYYHSIPSDLLHIR